MCFLKKLEKNAFSATVLNGNKLIAKEVSIGKYLLEDENRIINSSIKSKKIFPELVIDTKKRIQHMMTVLGLVILEVLVMI